MMAGILAQHRMAAQGTDVKKRYTSREFWLVVFVTLAHLPLGILLYNVGSFAMIHPIAAFSVGFYWSLRKDVSLQRVSLVVGYLVGAEILWRMAAVPIFWEFGKYGCVVIMVAALLVRRRLSIPLLPLIYFLALLPACVLTLISFDFSEARDTLSFNLSGPLLLAVSFWFFSNLRVSVVQLRRLLSSIVLPIFSVAIATLFFTLTTENIHFTSESNFETSGGFGPNQVASILALGVFIPLISLTVFKNSIKHKIYFSLTAIFFAVQSVMTFSRGGIYIAGGALLAVVLLEIRTPLKAVKLVIPLAIGAILFLFTIFPVLNEFTGGSLQTRFEETHTSHRAEIVDSDLQIFLDNPILGVGVGLARTSRIEYVGFSSASHTEFSRLISEHGVFGIVALLSFITILIINLIRPQPGLSRAILLGCAVWGGLFVASIGMRLAAPSVMLGMTSITITLLRAKRNRARNVLSPINTFD